MPRWDSLYNKCWWETLSNALEKSSKRRSIWFPAFRDKVRSWTVSIVIVLHRNGFSENRVILYKLYYAS